MHHGFRFFPYSVISMAAFCGHMLDKLICGNAVQCSATAKRRSSPVNECIGDLAPTDDASD
jgi:hypothetical protein